MRAEHDGGAVEVVPPGVRRSGWDENETVEFVIRVTPELAECFELLGRAMMERTGKEARAMGITEGAGLVRMFLYLVMMDDFRRVVSYGLKITRYCHREGIEGAGQAAWWQKSIADFAVKSIRQFLRSKENPWRKRKL